VRCAPGDVLTISAAGAGGWGDPLRRPIGEVIDDVAQGKVSEAGARSYGVVVRDGALDEAATTALRNQRGSRPQGMVFDPARLAFEKVWSDRAWDHLSARLFALPVEWRFFLKHEIFAAVNADAAAEVDSVAAIERAYARLLQLYPQIAPRTHGEAA